MPETNRQRAERLVNPYRNWMFGNAEKVIKSLEDEFNQLESEAYWRGRKDQENINNPSK